MTSLASSSTAPRKILSLNSSSGSLLYSFDISSHTSVKVFYPRYKEGLYSLCISANDGEKYEFLFSGCQVVEIKDVVRAILRPTGSSFGKEGSGKENSSGTANSKATTPILKKKKKRPNKTTPPPSSLQPPQAPLTEQQTKTLRLASLGYNIFISGEAGTGKSHLLRAIAASLSRRHEQGSVAVTSTTGTGACLVKGVTINSFSGLGISTPSTSAEVAKILSPKEHVIKRWRRTRVIIIDEVSMLSPELLEALDLAARWCRGKAEPMGGIQCIVVGDFFQLPPVKAKGLAFQSRTWSSMNFENVLLSVNFRQSDDSRWRSLLDRVRTGSMSSGDRQLLMRRRIPDGSNPPTSHRVTELHPRAAKVEEVNERLMKAEAKSTGVEIRTLEANDSGNKALLKECRGLKTLMLCEGAEVILTTNLNLQKGLANGTRGRLTGWTPDGLPIVRFKSARKGVGDIVKNVGRERWEYKLGNRCVAAREQLPLILGYAVSIHRSQGLTLPSIVVDFKGTFGGSGMVYTALSRVGSLEGLWIRGEIGRVQGDTRVKEFYKSISEEEEVEEAGNTNE